MFDRGEGPPVIVVPGLQGRWEWARPALEALSARCRAISYSLAGDIGSKERARPELGFENYVAQLNRVLDAARVERAVICGISFGGYIAVHYGATRRERVSALVLASAPGPDWRPTTQQSEWLSSPWLSTPAFVITSPARVWPEVSASFPDVVARAGFLARQGLRCLANPMMPPLMASRVASARAVDFAGDCRRIQLPTLIVTGEEPLDRVVPVGSTRRYSTLIPHAEYRVVPRTGHMAILTQPERFASIVSDFAHAHHH